MKTARRIAVALLVLGLGSVATAEKWRVIIPIINFDAEVEILPVTPPPVDTDGDGNPDETDPCDNDPLDTCDDPPPAGSHTHFDTLSAHPNAVASYSLRHANGDYSAYHWSPGTSHPSMHYDPVLDACRVTMEGANSFSTASQGFLRFPAPLGPDNCSSIVLQSEFRLSDSLRRAGTVSGVSTDDPSKLRALGNWKFMRIDRPDFVFGLEFQMRFNSTEQESVALPTLRSYIGQGDSRSADPISGPVDPGTPDLGTNYDMHPGPDSQAHYKDKGETQPTYELPAETWVRQTWEITYAADGLRVRWWLADENTDPVLIVADPADPSKGFLLGAHVEFAGWRHPEMNTSDGASYNPAHESWHVWLRNAVLLTNVKGESVLGDRPIP